ncbi:MAG: AAA family ATPase [Lachnospiraceae bacterium]|nr:AAA family ATPase [Lachnospiraceae bacterium]
MKILACYIENFGSLHHVKCSLRDGLNSLNERNGWGKSTFAVFLRAMFYGLDNCRNSSGYDEKDYRKNLNPWQGGNFGGYIEFETGAKRYRVTRFFKEKKRDDSFELLDLDTMLPSEDFSSSLGEELFGIDAYGYERSVYIPHNDLFIGTDDSVNSKLLGLLESDGDMNNFENAMKILNDARRELKKTGGRGKIDRSSEEKAGMEVRLRKALEGEKQTTEKKNSLAEAVKEKDGYKAEREQAEKALTEFTERNVSGGGRAGMMVFGILMILLGLAAGGLGAFAIVRLPMYYNYGLILAGAGGIVFLIGFILLIVRHSGISKNKKEFNTLQDAVTEKRKLFEAAAEKEAELKQEIDSLSRDYEDPEKLRQEIDRLQEATSEDTAKLVAIERTMRTLGEARQSLSGHYMDGLRDNFMKYLKKAGFGDNGAVMDSEFNISLESHGSMHSIMSESSGIKDLINLSARFALIDALFENDKPCVILDDVMNNLDEERFKNAMDMTEEFAKNYQVIYLTCNSSRVPAGL